MLLAQVPGQTDHALLVAMADHEGTEAVVEHLHYACGCQDFRDAFHDGSVHTRVVHHNGRVLVDEELRGE